mmetsp:Transcript_32924/g.53457  ORF Transcript_32924/g.53457 Transcript_32924/m.53457 type:complete len:212 (-) Transcript_32924:592-1227(-)
MIVYTAAGLLISANLMVMISSVNPAMISAAEHRNGDSYLGRRNQVSSHTRCQLQNLRGGALSVRSKRRKRRNSGRWLDPNFQRWYLERQMELQRILERRLYPHLFPPPSKKHPARIAAGLESPDPDPPYWQKYNLELQMQYGSLWYPRQNVSDNVVVTFLSSKHNSTHQNAISDVHSNRYKNLPLFLERGHGERKNRKSSIGSPGYIKSSC